MPDPATVDRTLRVVPGFRPEERDDLVSSLSSGLDRRLSRFDADHVELELSVKERDSSQQKVTLEGWIATKGRSRFVATSTESDVRKAVNEVRDDLRRQIDRFVTKQESARQGR
jgi:ribosome-associated translation inhibitor RaiA